MPYYNFNDVTSFCFTRPYKVYCSLTHDMTGRVLHAAGNAKARHGFDIPVLCIAILCLFTQKINTLVT